MKATELMEQTTGDANICIAVLDGPVDLNHPCFDKAKITQLESLAPDAAKDGPAAKHGTHVASLIFGQRGSHVHGVSPGCRGLIIPVFADGPDDSIAPCSQIDLAHAITQAVEQGAHVINISGGELVSSGEPHPLLDKAVRLCTENGVLIVAAVGNDGCQCLHVPASISSTLAVGAMDAQGSPLDFSNWGQMYQNNGILALGEKLMGAVPCDVATKTCRVNTKSGTSFSTPIVTGIVALLLSTQIQRGEKPDPHAIRKAILQSAHPCLPFRGLDCSRYLRGRLNIEGAYNLVTKKQQKATDSLNLAQQNQRNASTGLVESFKGLPVFGVQNSEFTTLNPEIVTSSTQISTLDAMKSLENTDSIELSIDKKKTKQTKNLLQETEMNEFNEQTSDITVSQIHASEVQAVESTMSNQEVVTSSITPSEVHPAACSTCGKRSLVYALGTLGYDFGSEARRDAFVQSMEGNRPNPDEPVQLLTHLEKNPEYAESLIWTLYIESTPVYAIRPMGSFASKTYEQLREFLEAQQAKKAERVSIPGVIAGKVKLLSGQVVPVIIPELRGLYCWREETVVKAAVRAVLGSELRGADDDTVKAVNAGARNFLVRVYYEFMNLGRTPQERAMNFAGTNAFQVVDVFEQAAKCQLTLDSIETERSPICRPDSDCWDVKLTFFDPNHSLTIARKVYRFTIDVSDVVPVSVGEVRSWSVR